jgi:hypothetical protein
MHMKTAFAASAFALATGASAMLAAPGQTQQPGQVTQQPGQMTQARVWIQNRGRGEAMPVTLHESALDAPLRVRVMNAQTSGNDDPANVRIVRQPRVWLYQTVTVKPDENLATALSEAGVAGWETTGIALTSPDGTTILLKRLR